MSQNRANAAGEEKSAVRLLAAKTHTITAHQETTLSAEVVIAIS